MFNIELRSGIPIYEQICNSVKEGVLKGYLKKGDPLPSVRKLASMLNINPTLLQNPMRSLKSRGSSLPKREGVLLYQTARTSMRISARPWRAYAPY